MLVVAWAPVAVKSLFRRRSGSMFAMSGVLHQGIICCRYTTATMMYLQHGSRVRSGTRMEQRTIADDLAEEVRSACLGMRVARLHRVVARAYEQELQTAGLSLPQMEILTVLITAAGPVRQAALAANLMAQRATVSPDPAPMPKRGSGTGPAASPPRPAMPVAITCTSV